MGLMAAEMAAHRQGHVASPQRTEETEDAPAVGGGT